jgi:ubiquitin-protein ligase
VSAVLRLRLEADRQRIQSLLSQASLATQCQILQAATILQPEWRFRILLLEGHSVEWHHLKVTFDQAYPFKAPIAHIFHESHLKAYWHPNVFNSGLICTGAQWLNSEGFDVYFRRIMRLLNFDPLLVNLASAANGPAAQWYRQTMLARPVADLELLKAWRSAESGSAI